MRLTLSAALAGTLVATLARADAPNTPDVPIASSDVVTTEVPPAETAPALPPRVRVDPQAPIVSIDAAVGFGAPLGWLGGGVSVRPIDRFGASAGVGLGTRGVQIAGMLHAYPFDLQKWARWGLGAGVSSGTYATSSFTSGLDLRWQRYWERAWFLNLQTSLAIWNDAGLRHGQAIPALGIEPFIGYGIVLNDRDGACSGWRSTCSHFTGVFFLGVTGHYGVF